MKFLRLPHQPQGFPVSLRSGHAEMTVQAALEVTSFPMPQHCHRNSVKVRDSAQHSGVLSAQAVSAKLCKAIKQCVYKL